MFEAIFPKRIGATLTLFCLLACVSACAEGTPEPRAPVRPAPAYTARAAELFDDGIDPAAAGYTANDVGQPKDDPVLRERTQTADTVVTALVVTLTSRQSDQGWLIGLRARETVAGRAPPPGDVILQVSANDRATGVLRALQDRLLGLPVVAFLRTFAAGRDGRQLHFHIAPDNPVELQAVRAATLLKDVVQ